MAPPTWTTDEERAFVFSKFQAFLAACSQGRAAQERWWDAFFPEWFSKFPTLGTLISRGDLPPDAVESTLTEEQKTMFGVEIQDKRKKLKNLFRNQRVKHLTSLGVDPNGRVTAGTAAARFAKKRVPRAHCDMEMFYVMYKDSLDPIINAAAERLKLTGDDGMPEHIEEDVSQDADDEGNEDGTKSLRPKKKNKKKRKGLVSLPVTEPGWMLALRRRVFAFQWAEAGEAVWDSVYNAMEMERDALEKKRLEDTAKGLERAPQDRQRHCLPAWWAVNARTAHHELGMVTLQMGVTIDPMEPWKLRGQVLAFGTNSDGKVFSDVANFADNYYHPFLQWAERHIFADALAKGREAPPPQWSDSGSKAENSLITMPPTGGPTNADDASDQETLSHLPLTPHVDPSSNSPGTPPPHQSQSLPSGDTLGNRAVLPPPPPQTPDPLDHRTVLLPPPPPETPRTEPVDHRTVLLPPPPPQTPQNKTLESRDHDPSGQALRTPSFPSAPTPSFMNDPSNVINRPLFAQSPSFSIENHPPASVLLRPVASPLKTPESLPSRSSPGAPPAPSPARQPGPAPAPSPARQPGPAPSIASRRAVFGKKSNVAMRVASGPAPKEKAQEPREAGEEPRESGDQAGPDQAVVTPNPLTGKGRKARKRKQPPQVSEVAVNSTVGVPPAAKRARKATNTKKVAEPVAVVDPPPTSKRVRKPTKFADGTVSRAK